MYSIEIDSVKKADWSSLLQQFDDATIYHTWSCGEVLWGENTLSHVICREGDEVVGLAQVATIKPPFIRGGTALIFWGPLWRKREKKRERKVFSNLIGLLRAEYVERRGMFLRIIPHELKTNESTVRPILEKAGFQFKGRFYRTYILDISISLVDLRKNLSQKWRSCLNYAERAPLTVTQGTSLEFYTSFYGIFREMRKRKQITDISIDRDNVTHLVIGGRSRWKIENETFNTLKNQGYHLEHNFGHGKKYLSMNFFLLNLLAFFMHQIFELTDFLYQKCRGKFSARKEYWNQLRCTFRILLFNSWETLLRFIISPPLARAP